jgi:hypothetical protein
MEAGSNAAPAGWYADPYARAPYRWFDGSTWTAHVHGAAPAAPAHPAVAAPAASVPFVSDVGLDAAAVHRPQVAVQPQPMHAVAPATSRFGTPLVAPADPVGFAVAHSGVGSDVGPTAYGPGYGYGYRQAVVPVRAEERALPTSRIVAGVAALVVLAIAAALVAPRIFPRLAHHGLAAAPPATLAGAAPDTSAASQSALLQLRPIADRAFSGLPTKPVLVLQSYGTPAGGVTGERLVVVWAASKDTFPQDQAAPELVAGMKASGVSGAIVMDATPDGGTFGCVAPDQYKGALSACAWARSGTGFIVVYDVGGSLEQARAHTVAVVSELLR